MNYERNNKYFTQAIPVPKPYLGPLALLASVLTTTGFMLLVLGFIFEDFIGMIGIGIPMLILGIFCISTCRKISKAGANGTKNKICDNEIDMQLTNYFKQQNLKERALEKLGLDESEVMEIDPVYFDGYHFEGAQIKVGDDNQARSSLGRAIYFFFTQNEVHCYTHTVSLITNFYSEDTDTYFYSDIVSVSTVTSSGVTPQQRTYQYDSFKLTTKGGTSIQASLRDKAGTERSINGMRNLIKAKKQGQ
jgi:hypothetical protein